MSNTFAPLPNNDAFADFADGVSARIQRVGVNLASDRVNLTLPDGKKLTWPMESLRALPDQADRESLVLTSTDMPLARLYLRDTALSGVVRQAAANLHRRPPVENIGRLLKWGVAAFASVALIVFVLVPVMADQLARYLPPEGEKALGDTTFEQIRNVLDDTGFEPIRVCETTAGTAAMQTMLARLNPVADLPYDIQVTVLDHEMVNAFALPGGRIVFFRGLINEAQSAEEVAAVFAHEIGHVVNRDPTRDALRSAGSIGVLGLLFGDFAGGTVVLFLANRLINATYSQKAEAGADSYAHGLMTQAGLSPASLGTMFLRLKARYGEQEGLVAHFAAHPQLSERIERSLAAAQEVVVTQPILSAQEWSGLRNICGRTAAAEQPSGGGAKDNKEK
ncbi:MAG TPA: M48 family metallopeptidase [Aliiroseovarius sp.]|nr:M48 family metallopeptidase [Aliiroseovarius sp.]